MQLVIDNYSNPLSTEPMYFDACLRRAGVSSVLWNRNTTSVYDIIDAYNPNVFITHIRTIPSDLIKYIVQNRSLLDVIVNITGASQEEVDALGKMLQKNNVNCPFLFRNEILQRNPVVAAPSSMKIESIFYGADMFLTSNQTIPGPKLQAGIVSVGNDVPQSLLDEACTDFDTYHKIIIGEKTEDYDLSVSVVDLIALYPKYDEIILLNKDYANACNQILLDAVMRNGEVDVQCTQHFTAGELDSVIYNVKSKYTCWHSTGRLLSKLKMKDESIALYKAAENLT